MRKRNEKIHQEYKKATFIFNKLIKIELFNFSARNIALFLIEAYAITIDCFYVDLFYKWLVVLFLFYL